jgi:imidazolonepropionase-like amidohydrolase
MSAPADDILVVIKNGTLIDGTGGRPRPNRYPRREERRGRSGAPSDQGGGAGFIDAARRFILPGLIDGHVHLSMFQGARLSDERRILHAAGGPDLMPILRAGFTSVSVSGGKWFVDVTLRDAVNSGMLEGPRIFCAGRALTPRRHLRQPALGRGRAAGRCNRRAVPNGR